MKIASLIVFSVLAGCASKSNCIFSGLERSDWVRIERPEIKLGHLVSDTPGSEEYAEWYLSKEGQYGRCMPCTDDYEYGGSFDLLKESDGVYETDQIMVRNCGPY